jgi:hypothetical protein
VNDPIRHPFPGSVTEDKEGPPYFQNGRCLIIDTGERLRVYSDTRPHPTLVLDEPYEDRELRAPRRGPVHTIEDNRHRYYLLDGRQLLVGYGSGCACGQLRSWEPPPAPAASSLELASPEPADR